MLNLARHYWSRLLTAHRSYVARRGDLDDAPGWSPLEKAWAFFIAGLGFALVGVLRYIGIF